MTPLGGLSIRCIVVHAAGVLLMIAGVGVAAMTAHSLITYRAIAGRHGGEAMDLGSNASLQAGQYGHMARVVGMLNVVESPVDPEFGLRVDTPVLIRHVEMFQWREIRFGGDVSYDLDWVDHPLDSSRFRQPAGHANPAAFPLVGKSFDAGLVQVGGFRLSPELVHALPGSSVVAPDLKALPPNLAASFSINENYLTTSGQPNSPRLGDVRVSWEQIPLRQMTVFARIDGDRLVPTDATVGKGFDIEVGQVSLQDMQPDVPAPPEFVTVRYVTSVWLAALGALVLMVARNRRRDPLLALGLGALVVGAVCAVLWLGNDTWTMAAWLLAAVLGTALAVWRLRALHAAHD